MKNKTFFVILVGAFLVIAYLLYFITTEGKQCLENPYIYGANAMGNIYCSCTQDNIGTCDPTFTFNDTDFTTTPAICEAESDYTDSYLNNGSVIIEIL